MTDKLRNQQMEGKMSETIKWTPEMAAKEMERIEAEHKGDPEATHAELDKLMLDILSSFGYKEAVKIFNRTEKWYG